MRKSCVSSRAPRTEPGFRSTSSGAKARCSMARTPCCSTGMAAMASVWSPNFSGPAGGCGWTAAGIFVVANLRGGGEFGETWHAAGRPHPQAKRIRRLHRLGAVPDRPALHEPQHLAIMGGSNGGLLMGAVIHTASGTVPRSRFRRSASTTCCAWNSIRTALQHHGVRLGQGPGTIQGALRLLTLSSRGGWHGVSRHFHVHGSHRRPGEPRAFAQNDRAAASGDSSGKAGVPQHQFPCRARHRQFARRSASIRRPTSTLSLRSARHAVAGEALARPGPHRLMESIARLSTASAASWMASDSVGCAWMVRCRSSVLAEYSIASTASADQFARHRADHVDPKISSSSLAETIFAMPCAASIARARPLAANGNAPDLVGRGRSP